MKLIVVFPDNSVEINGQEVKWTEEDFKRYSIETERVRIGVLGSSETRQLPDGGELIIFPTQESPSEVYANAKTNVLNPHGRRGRKPGRPPGTGKNGKVEHGIQKHRGVPRRWHRHEGPVLYLRCQGGCNRELPASEFNKSARQAFGRQGMCRDCQRNYYLQKKKTSNIKS